MPALAGWRRSQTVPSAVELVPEETKGVKRVRRDACGYHDAPLVVIGLMRSRGACLVTMAAGW